MIQEKLYNSDTNSLFKNVIIVTLLTILFLFLVGRFGGGIIDKITESTCNSINETYVSGDSPGEGICVKTTGTIDSKK